MKFDLHLRSSVREQIEQITAEMKSREERPRLEKSEEEVIRKRIQPFNHTTQKEKLLVGAVNAGGDFPSVTYGDSFIYLTIAQSVLYTVDAISKLREVESPAQPTTLFSLLPEDEVPRRHAFDEAFFKLTGLPIAEVIEKSDYRSIKASETRKTVNAEVLLRELIGFFAISKSLGIPWIELLEQIARERLSGEQEGQPENWYLRLPVAGLDGWQFSLTKNRKLPPAGAVSYLVRFHRVSPLMRLDMDMAKEISIIEAQIDGILIPIIDMDSLLKNKRAAGRDQDLVDVRKLERRSSRLGRSID